MEVFEWMGKKTDHELRGGVLFGDPNRNGGAVLVSRSIYT